MSDGAQTRAGHGASGHHRHRHHHARLLLAAGAALGLMGTQALAQQWTAINLHPAGATSSVAEDVEGVVQIGTLDVDQKAVVWRSSAWSVRSLNPGANFRSTGRAIDGGQQVGQAGALTSPGRAALWNGTAQSWVDLHPYHVPDMGITLAYTKHGSTVGGIYSVAGGPIFQLGKPCIWTDGTPESWVSLLPAGYTYGEVLGIFGNQQVGSTNDEFLGKAAMWHGTAESFVDLNPPEAFASVAACTDGTHQYGAVGVLAPVPGIFAARWSGTASSWEDMGQPEGWFGGIYAVHGGWKAGSIQSPEGTEERAMVWTGGPGSYVDLHDALPAGAYSMSVAFGIWRHMESGTTYVVGSATNAETLNTEAMMWVTGPGVNLITSALAPADCSTAPGDTMVYTARVINAGEDAAGSVTLTVELPPASVATFAGSSPAPSSVSPTHVTIDLGSLAGVGGYADVTVNLTAVQAGAVAELGFVATAAGEVHAENNAATAASQITPTPPSQAVATAVFSTDPSLDNSLIPGLDGVRFTGFGTVAASPSGAWWAVMAGSDLPQTHRNMVLRTPTGGTPVVVAQYGVTETSNGFLNDLLPAVEVNDSGLVAFSAGDDGPIPGRFVGTTDGTTLTEVARTGEPIPALPGERYDTLLGGSPNLLADGTVAFRTVTDWGNQVFLSANGSVVLAQTFVTVPDGADWPLVELDDEIFNRGGCQVDATGEHFIYTGRLATGSDADDRVVVADGTVVLQEGAPIPGMSSPMGEWVNFTMGPSGVWMVRAVTVDTQTCVVMGQGTTITRVFKQGDPIHAGATEVWAPDPVAGSFFAYAADAAGNFIVGSTTDHASDFRDAVLVYNDEVVLARESDPVDLDGNGVFDDGVYIHSFDGQPAFVSGGVLIRVSLRDEAAALCEANDEVVGQAIVLLPLPGGACPVDWNGDGSVNSTDISAFLTGWLTSLQNGTLDADFNGDNVVNSTDISAFLTAWLQAVQNGC
jgi:hypothetical protein